jgi:hypothetical protein
MCSRQSTSLGSTLHFSIDSGVSTCSRQALSAKYGLGFQRQCRGRGNYYPGRWAARPHHSLALVHLKGGISASIRRFDKGIFLFQLCQFGHLLVFPLVIQLCPGQRKSPRRGHKTSPSSGSDQTRAGLADQITRRHTSRPFSKSARPLADWYSWHQRKAARTSQRECRDGRATFSAPSRSSAADAPAA